MVSPTQQPGRLGALSTDVQLILVPRGLPAPGAPVLPPASLPPTPGISQGDTAGPPGVHLGVPCTWSAWSPGLPHTPPPGPGRLPPNLPTVPISQPPGFTPGASPGFQVTSWHQASPRPHSGTLSRVRSCVSELCNWFPKCPLLIQHREPTHRPSDSECAGTGPRVPRFSRAHPPSLFCRSPDSRMARTAAPLSVCPLAVMLGEAPSGTHAASDTRLGVLGTHVTREPC